MSISMLFSKTEIKRTLLAMVPSVSALFGSYTMTSWMPTFLVKQGLTVTKSHAYNTTMMAGFACGSLLVALLADRIGRRWGVVAFGIICASFGCIYPFLTLPGWYLLVALLFTFVGVGTNQQSVEALEPEPTAPTLPRVVTARHI